MKRFRFKGRELSRKDMAQIMDDASFRGKKYWHFIYPAFTYEAFLAIFKEYLASN